MAPARSTHIVTGRRRVPSSRTDASVSSSASLIVLSSSLVHVVICILLELDLELEDVAVVHAAVAVGYLVECSGAVEDASRLDSAFEDVGEQLVDVGADGGGAAGHAGVLPEGDAGRCGVVFGHADAADRTAGACDLERGDDRLLETDHSSTECAPNPPVSSRTR